MTNPTPNERLNALEKELTRWNRLVLEANYVAKLESERDIYKAKAEEWAIACGKAEAERDTLVRDLKWAKESRPYRDAVVRADALRDEGKKYLVYESRGSYIVYVNGLCVPGDLVTIRKVVPDA